MGSENIGFEASPEASKAFWRLLHEAIQQGTALRGEENISPLGHACKAYANSLSESVKAMIATKAKDV